MIKKKYKNTHRDLIKRLISRGETTTVLSINVIETSKVKGYLIYECMYLDNGVEKTTTIIAEDITEAKSKLEPLLNSGIPGSTVSYVLGSNIALNVNKEE